MKHIEGSRIEVDAVFGEPRPLHPRCPNCGQTTLTFERGQKESRCEACLEMIDYNELVEFLAGGPEEWDPPEPGPQLAAEMEACYEAEIRTSEAMAALDDTLGRVA